MRNESAGMPGRDDPGAPTRLHAMAEHADILRSHFGTLYDIVGWGHAPPPPAYPHGPVPGAGVAVRRLADPEAGFYSAMMWAEASLLPMCVAHTEVEKVDLVWAIGRILGLDTAVERGWIAGYVVCWQHGRRPFPAMATRLRILRAPGRRTRTEVLGRTLERNVRRFVDAMLTVPD